MIIIIKKITKLHSSFISLIKITFDNNFYKIVHEEHTIRDEKKYEKIFDSKDQIYNYIVSILSYEKMTKISIDLISEDKITKIHYNKLRGIKSFLSTLKKKVNMIDNINTPSLQILKDKIEYIEVRNPITTNKVITSELELSVMKEVINKKREKKGDIIVMNKPVFTINKKE